MLSIFTSTFLRFGTMAKSSADCDYTFKHGDVLVHVQNYFVSVSGTVLRHSSSVFDAMLSELFMEGSTCTIELPEDDYDAFLLYCKIIHHMEVSPDQPNGLLLSLAKLCEKYQLQTALFHHAREWCRSWTKDTSTSDLSELLVLAYVVNSPDDFSTISRRIIQSHSGSFADLAFCNSDFENLTPKSFAGMSWQQPVASLSY